MKYIITALLFVLSLCINAQDYTAAYIESVKDIAIESTRELISPCRLKLRKAYLKPVGGGLIFA
jgi:hypothetical protein